MIANNVVVAFLRKEFDGEASHIPNCVRTALFSSSSAEAEEHLGLLANAIEELGAGQRGNIVGDLEFTPSTGSFGMNDSDQTSEDAVSQVMWLDNCLPFWDTLTVEMR